MTGQDLSLLHEKIDALAAQIERQNDRQQRLDDLKDDMTPILDHMVRLTIQELDEVGADFELEDLLHLLKRLLRNTRRFDALMDLFESGMDLADEVKLHGREVMTTGINTLSALERQGYFTFAESGLRILNRVVEEFNEEDLHALEDNVVLILRTVRNLTRPEILTLANQALNVMGEPQPEKPPSMLRLARTASDPDVRIGMARLLAIVKMLASQPNAATRSTEPNP